VGIELPDCSTERGFQRALRRVVHHAEANGVDVRGSWTVETEAGPYDVEVVRLDEDSRE
jgi:hypothetical protein